MFFHITSKLSAVFAIFNLCNFRAICTLCSRSRVNIIFHLFVQFSLIKLWPFIFRLYKRVHIFICYKFHLVFIILFPSSLSFYNIYILLYCFCLIFFLWFSFLHNLSSFFPIILFLRFIFLLHVP